MRNLVVSNVCKQIEQTFTLAKKEPILDDRRGAVGRSEDGDVHCSAATDSNADVLHQAPAAVLGWRIGMAGGGGDKGRGSPDIIETWFVDADANGWARRKFPAESRP